MMRPMKLAGSELMFGKGSLEYIKTSVYCKRAIIVIGGKSVEKNGTLAKVEEYFHANGAQTTVFEGVEPDPHFATVKAGANVMTEWQPDLICALGGGSVMDAAKTMWVMYEHPELDTLDKILSTKPLPKLRAKARFMCIPSTSGTASEVSRSVVISDDETGHKHGLGDMEMMPDIAIVDPLVSCSMPAHVTAETGMDALTHAIEALVSNRANYVSNILAIAAAKDIVTWLPKAYADGNNMEAREMMANASMTAGLAFTNVSLGIDHSMAQTIAGFFPMAHGRICAILLPYTIEWNSQDLRAKQIYTDFGALIGTDNLAQYVRELNIAVGIPHCIREIVPDKDAFMAVLDDMARLSLADGCTKTNPIIPTVPQFAELIEKAYLG
ncbi:iron-containing alcohol dehydrogenase [Olegusella massiliensis]|uniref:iron-containing alcohol dehydrogenase n=1 Tax=Olegusella massiliensis TaxID=1776381 RepID=UPI0005537AFE|nr:iron-containing alcohol dehydrogenase [Olegusella massiliensis]MBS5865553.1 iron-containing alcohol dehydrogenase [Coriobacteriaceae bacterium]